MPADADITYRGIKLIFMKKVLLELISLILILLGVILLIFIMLRVIPGDPASILLGEHYSQETIDRLTRAMNLDKSLPEQFFSYIAGLLRGDLGVSYVKNRPVRDLILLAFPYTARLALLAAVIAWVIGLAAGITAAVTENEIPDRFFMGFSLIGVSVPIFMTALFLQYIFAYKLKLFPMSSDGSLISLVLPAIALGWNSAGAIARLTRSSLIDALQADYIQTAWAKGLSRRTVILGHALKNAMLPVITMMALQLSSLMSGAVITESIFAIPGIGRLATEAIQNRDMPLLQGTIIFTAILVIVGNLLADLLYMVLDPRIRRRG